MFYTPPPTDDRRIWELWLTHTHQVAVIAADDAGVFTAVDEEPAIPAELARRLDSTSAPRESCCASSRRSG